MTSHVAAVCAAITAYVGSFAWLSEGHIDRGHGEALQA